MTCSHHTQPDATRGAVAKPNSSAPSNAATATSRPVLIVRRILRRHDFAGHLELKFAVLRQVLVPMDSCMLQ
jgi:hypothetical protein